MLESLSRPRASLNFRRFGLCRVFVCRTNEIGLETTSPFLVRAIVLNVPVWRLEIPPPFAAS